ncbi:MAG TPA: GH3 auxin-responsive promoter family protein, partial [Candidatus Polarisedimenticolaceae bacterium]|nr:GH3 auxin-responsive promoter family protein [Candidatus Polarisedimenticolaceae bacterium]
RRIWPRLGMISCWADGNSRGAADRLRHRFPDVTIEPKGLIATEAFVSLPFDGSVPLAVRSHFFEFLDAGETPHGAHELREGEEYSVVVTTGGGLYRYRLQDRIVVTGFLHRTPCVRFLGKEDNVSDLCGEKLTEGFVASCQRDVFQRHGLAPSFAMLAPDAGDARYALFIQCERTIPAELGTELDRALGENPHYRYCRDLGQLAPLRVAPIGAGAYSRYVERCRAAGRRVGDVKPSSLDSRHGWAGVFET